jgi:hypothetical protein
MLFMANGQRPVRTVAAFQNGGLCGVGARDGMREETQDIENLRPPVVRERLRERRVCRSSLPMHKPHSIPNDEIKVPQIHLITRFIEAEGVANW